MLYLEISPVPSHTNFQARHEENSKNKGKSTCEASNSEVHQLFRGKYLEKCGKKVEDFSPHRKWHARGSQLPDLATHQQSTHEILLPEKRSTTTKTIKMSDQGGEITSDICAVTASPIRTPKGETRLRMKWSFFCNVYNQLVENITLGRDLK